VATGIGGGILTLPWVCKEVGLGYGLILLFLGMIATLWSFTLLIETACTTNIKNVEQMCEAVGGRTLLCFYQTGLVFLLFGAVVGFQVISKFSIPYYAYRC
jgi:amino acid permease